MKIDTFVENFSGAILKVAAASTRKRRPRDDPRPPIPASNQNVIRMKNRLLRQWQITVEDDQTGDEIFYSIAYPGHPGGLSFSR